MICPKCHQNRAHRSHRENFRDRFYRLFQMIPYRCHACNNRFFAYRAGKTSARLRTPEELKVISLRRRMRWRRNKQVLFTYAIAALILAGIMYEILQQTVRNG